MARYKAFFTRTVEEKMEIEVEIADNLTPDELDIALNEAAFDPDSHPDMVDSNIQSVSNVTSFKRLDD
jgi:NAD kinase